MVSDVTIKKVPNLPFYASSDGTIYSERGKAYRANEQKSGYLRISTRINGKSKSFLLHRLVALAFIENPNRLPCVNHKDENKQNNSAENLEWCDYKYNANYGTRGEKIGEKLINRCDQSKIVIRIFNGDEIPYQSAKQAERELQINNANIISCCKGKRKTAGGYEWRYG